MPTQKTSAHRTLLLVFAGIASVGILLLSFALFLRVINWSRPGAAPPAVDKAAVAAPAAASPARGGAPASTGPRFTLRLGQGFRFGDGALVVPGPAQSADVAFRYLPPRIGGGTRYNPISKQVEVGFEPNLTMAVPLVTAAHVQAFDRKPDLARTTTGDVAAFSGQAPIHSNGRFLLVRSAAGEHYLLTLDQLDAPDGKFDDWRIGFTYERVTLPLGLAGGQISSPLPGRLVFRDSYRSRMVVGVDLTTGRETPVGDGTCPTALPDGTLGLVDAAGAYVIRDAAGVVRHTVRLNERGTEPVLSPDGKRLAVSVYRPGDPVQIGAVTIAGSEVASVAVFDTAGREVACFRGYDDPVWAPDGKLIATGKLVDPGLFELDPETARVRTIEATVAYPRWPAVSADGRTIAFVTGQRVWLIDRDGKNLRQLLPHGMQQQRPAFSPDGAKVAVVICNHFAVDFTGDLFVVDVKTKELTPLRTNTGIAPEPDSTSRLSWVP